MSAPDYLAYTIPCPLNAGKLVHVTAFVRKWRQLAEREAAWQWRQYFQTRGVEGFEASATKGWTRPWVGSGESSVTLAQQVMAQVAGQLKGHMGQVENTFACLVARSSLSSEDKHRLFSLNRRQLWLAPCAVVSPIKGEAVLPEHIRKLGRKIFHQAFRQHRLPGFKHHHPQLDQRSVSLGFAKTAQTFPLWANVSTLEKGKTVALPLPAWQELMDTLRETSQALAPTHEAKALAKRQRAEAKRKEEGRAPASSHRALREAQLCSLPQTVRLILRHRDKFNPSSPLELFLGVVVDHSAKRELDRQNYRPVPGKTATFDLGISTLLATDEGSLLGRNWLEKLQKFDAKLLGIAQGQQKRGLPITTPRYRKLTTRLDGFIKSEVFRIVNAWVEKVRPEKILREQVSFQKNPQLSGRLNRLLSRFGKRYLELALKRLEATHGIVVESRQAAYSSQQCHCCGYIDSKNRKSQSEFQCLFCNKKVHADVNAARVVRDRRSVAASPSSPAQRKLCLNEQVRMFMQNFPIPSTASSGCQPLACGRKDDPRWQNPYFKAVLAALGGEVATPPSVFARGG